MKYSLVVVPCIFILAEVLVLNTHEKMRWADILKCRFLYLVPLISAGIFSLASLISFAPQYGWTWKNVLMVFLPFSMRLEYTALQEFEFDFLANFSFLEKHMTLPWFFLMIMGMVFCLKKMKWQNLVVWSWFLGFITFLTFVNWDYHVQYLFPVMPACYFFSLYALENLNSWSEERMAGKGYLSALKTCVIAALLIWPVMNFADEIQSLRSNFYSKDTASRIVSKLKRLAPEKDQHVWFLGAYYPLYQPGQQIHPQDKFYKIYHLGNNALSFLSAKRIRSIPISTPYKFSTHINSGNVLIYYPGPFVTSKSLPKPERLPPVYVGKIEPTVLVYKNQEGNVKNFETKDGLSNIQLTFKKNRQIVIEVNMIEKEAPLSIVWFKLDNRIINDKGMEKDFFYFESNKIAVLPAGRDYFERIQEITFLHYQAEGFR